MKLFQNLRRELDSIDALILIHPDYEYLNGIIYTNIAFASFYLASQKKQIYVVPEESEERVLSSFDSDVSKLWNIVKSSIYFFPGDLISNIENNYGTNNLTVGFGGVGKNLCIPCFGNRSCELYVGPKGLDLPETLDPHAGYIKNKKLETGLFIPELTN